MEKSMHRRRFMRQSMLTLAGAISLDAFPHSLFAADTPNGLVVPVIANADRLNVFEIARALASLSDKARGGKLKATEMRNWL